MEPQPTKNHTVVIAAQHNVVITTQQTNNVKPAAQRAYRCGIIQVIGGILSIMFGAGMVLFFITGYGIWCGIFFIVNGSFGIATKNHNKCRIITNMVLSIISASLFAPVFLILTGLNLWIYNGISMAVWGTAMLIGLILFISTIISAVVSCNAVCGKKQEEVQCIVLTTGEGAIGHKQIDISPKNNDPAMKQDAPPPYYTMDSKVPMKY